MNTPNPQLAIYADTIREMYTKRASLNEMSRACDIPATTIAEWLRRQGYPPIRRTREEWCSYFLRRGVL